MEKQKTGMWAKEQFLLHSLEHFLSILFLKLLVEGTAVPQCLQGIHSRNFLPKINDAQVPYIKWNSIVGHMCPGFCCKSVLPKVKG